MKNESIFNCPCCGFPTLTELGVYEICSVCWWEDDGQSDHNADSVMGGPNGSYSLNEARRNFALHGHMYDAGKGNDVVERPTPQRLALLEFVRRTLSNETALNIREFNELLAASDRSH